MGVVPQLERATYHAERPIRRLVGSNRLNPLPHAGPISVFLLAVVVITGVYITLFFQFGFEASYESVQRMEDHPIQNVVRSIHRYASAGLVLTTLVHGWRIFVAGRFRGPRRWRWTTGIAALVIVWLAGVTGYWLVWDERAQALNEATLGMFGGLRSVSGFFVRDVMGSGAGSGWSVMFLLWIAHLGLTVVVGWFLWRHVRRSRLAVLPPRHWMIVMSAALLVVSVIVPADLLGPVDLGRLVGDMPLDPFVLFLLPPALQGWGWPAAGVLALVVTAALVGPHVLSRRAPVVVVDVERCTGCELCVIDCPYLAIEMHERSMADEVEGTQPRRPIAVVDPAACVGCGICVGSCSFGALELPGFETFQPATAVDPTGREVVLACTRHLRAAGAVRLPDGRLVGADDDGETIELVEVACSGMVHANTVGALMRAGATGVHVVGCPAGDCAYGLGNTILAERLAGTRAPHVPARWAGAAAEDWVAPTELAGALAHPGDHADVDASHPPTGRRRAAAAVLVLGSIAAVVLATQAPFRADDDRTAVRVLVDHAPGSRLEGQPTATGAPGDDVVVVVRVGGAEVRREQVPTSGGFAVGVVDVGLDPGRAALDVSLVEGAAETPLLVGDVELAAGRRVVVEAVDVPPPPGVAEGRAVFDERSLGGCGVCHSTRRGDDGVGPSLYGVADAAETRVPGMSAEEYLRESVLDPDAYIVDGYRAGQMLPTYRDRLSDDQVDALVEYLLSLRGEEVQEGADR